MNMVCHPVYLERDMSLVFDNASDLGVEFILETAFDHREVSFYPDDYVEIDTRIGIRHFCSWFCFFCDGLG